jgi:hypothetical protein
MKKIFLVFAVVALASLAASATNINYSFDGFCDAMEFTQTGSPKVYLDGVHDYSGCFGTSEFNVLVGGFDHTAPGNPALFDLFDPTYGYLYGLPYPLEYLSLANTKLPCDWALYIDFTGTGHVLGNSGTCTYFKSPALRPAVAQGTPKSFPKAK